MKSFDAELEKLVDAISSVGISEAPASRLKRLEAEKSKVNNRLRVLASSPERQIPDIQAMFKEILMRLNEEIGNDAQTAKTILSGIFGQVVLELRGGGEVWGKVETRPKRLNLHLSRREWWLRGQDLYVLDARNASFAHRIC